MELTPELIEAIGKIVIAIMTGAGTIVTALIGYFTWKTRYELDLLYAKKREAETGQCGQMRKHPETMVKLFKRSEKDASNREAPREVPSEHNVASTESSADGDSSRDAS